MFDIWASLAELRQPRLRRPISDRLFAVDGLLRREVLTSLDRLFCEHLTAGRASFQAPATPPPIPAAHRFINVSALQKAIRRGDAEGAMRYAQQGCHLNAEQVFRRLATCAVEDVGIGNLLVVGMALAVMGSKAMRENGARDELATYLAYLLAVSPKSRLACDLLSIADYDRSLASLKDRLAKADVAVLAGAASDRATPYAHRMIAGWLLAGTSRFRGTTMPAVTRDRRDFMRLLVVERVPLMFYYIADRTAARLADAMFVSTLPIAQIMASDPTITVHRTPIDTAIIAGFPAAAFDLHTYEGRIALRRFSRECPPVAAKLASLTPSMRDTAIRHGAFIAEGGLLSQQLCFATGEQTERDAHYTELAFAGITDQKMRTSLVEQIQENLLALNHLRAQVLGQDM